MSNFIVWANNASSTLASAILSTDTQCTVQSGQGALFPTIAAGQIAVATLEDVNGNIEVVWATAKSTDTFTITRAQEGTTALGFASGSRFELRVTAGVLGALLQKGGGDTLSGTTTVTGVLALGSSGSIQGGEFTGAFRGAPGLTTNQILVPSGGGAPTAGGSVILTAANIAGNMPAGTDVARTNMIVFWAGASNAIPTGWHLCDGTNGTPDLRDQFIVGGGGAMATSGGSVQTDTQGAHTHSGNTGGYTLQIADIPSHSHSPITADSTVNTGGIGTFMVITNNTNGGFVSPRSLSNSSVGNTGGGGSHSHPISSDGAHFHNHTPPYRAVFAIMKL